MKVNNIEVYGLAESMKASGFPMMAEISDDYYDFFVGSKDMKRMKNLGQAKAGSGHDCFLKGIIVQYDLRCNHVMLPQFQRYHFHDIISSQSKMHRIMKMDLESSVDKYVNKTVLEGANEEIFKYEQMVEFGQDKYTKEEIAHQYEIVMSNLPLGLELTMRVTSNYLQLKSIYYQRRTHKMKFWRDYCDWIESLPYMDVVLGLESDGE